MTLGAPLAEDVPSFLIAFGLILGLIAICEVLKKGLGVQAKVTRKIVHIGTGIFVFFAPYFFRSNFYPALIPIVFIPFNLLGSAIWLAAVSTRHRSAHREHPKLWHGVFSDSLPCADTAVLGRSGLDYANRYDSVGAC
jgi:hypothetical protein